jgi:methylated-DNA-[protein]-cysteine S-methyltransferase
VTIPCAVFESALGWVGIAATESGIIHSVLPMRTRDGVLRELEIPTAALDRLVEPTTDVVEALSAYFSGEVVDLGAFPLDLAWGTPFARCVWGVVRGIGRGKTLTYREVGRRVGSPTASRAVGGAVGKNPAAPFIPCHRVVGSGGALVGFSAEGGLGLKRRLLEMEGVRFSGDRVA